MLDPFAWEWAVANLRQDDKEESERVAEIFKSGLQALKPWLSYELWQAEQRQREHPPTPSSTYTDELRKRGVTEEELQPVLELQQQLLGSVAEDGSDEDEFDPDPVIITR